MPNISHTLVFIDTAPVRSSPHWARAEILVDLDIRSLRLLPAVRVVDGMAQNVNIAPVMQAP
jgi:hypothetical protein